MDCAFPSGQSSEIRSIASDGSQTGAWIGPDGVTHAMSLHNLVASSAWFQPALALGGIASSQNMTVSYVGSETKDGVSVTHLTVVQQFPANLSDTSALMQHLSQMDLFLDTTTFLPDCIGFSNVHPDKNALPRYPSGRFALSGYTPS